MDVFTNALEGVRQYFQGLPAATGSTAGPAYNQANVADQSHDGRTSSGVPYWPPQPEIPVRPAAHEETSQQRPSSHHSEPSRPPSHHNAQHEIKTQSQQNNYSGAAYHDTSQPFQFSVPLSREAPSNISQQYQSHILPNPSYHQPQSPQTPRTSSRQDITSPHSYHQLQPPQNPPHSHAHTQHPYSYHQQNRSYYPVQSQSSKPTTPVNTVYKTASNQSYTNNYDAYNNKSYIQQQQSTLSSPNTPSYATIKPVTPSHSQEIKQDNQKHSVSQHRTTHNLPPIAALSVNYHTNRSNREAIRAATNKTRSTTSTSTSTAQITSKPVNNVPIPPAQTQQQPIRVPTHNPYENTNYRSSSQYVAPNTCLSQNVSNYNTTTAYSYSPASTTSAINYSTPTYYPSSTHQNVQVSIKPCNNAEVQRGQYQSSTNHPLPSAAVVPTVDSVLDLSLKTIKTPADSTLDDSDDAQRNTKYLQSSRQVQQPAAARYPTHDASYNSSFQRNTNSRSIQPTATAPKFDFLPNFNMPLNQQNYKTDRRQLPPSNHQSGLPYDQKNSSNYANSLQQQVHSVQRFHTPNSLPAQSHNNIYQTIPKKSVDGLPRVDFPPSTHSQGPKSTPPVYAGQHDSTRKRTTDPAPTVPPTKKQKGDDRWRVAIDQQIEQKFSTYQSLIQDVKQPSSKSHINGNFLAAGQSNTYLVNQYQMQPQLQYPNTNQYHQPQMNHNQTYVPSAVAHPYPGHLPQQQQVVYQQQGLQIQHSNSQSSLTSRSHAGGGADKRVISILRTNLEMKGAKEAQKKIEQNQFKPYEAFMQRPREVQHPSTDVMAPLQPKLGIIGRQNVSPFTASSLLDRNTPPTYKFPKAIDSIRFELEMKDCEKQMHSQPLLGTNNSTTDLDGLAANLAARIRTKGELKQVTQANNAINQAIQMEYASVKAEIAASIMNGSANVSPPKLLKDKPQYSPRHRLFSKSEEDVSGLPTNSNIPLRNTGLRSSSETSVFDFPDSDSETEMPVLERQSLEAMRRDRKSVSKQSLVNENDFKEESVKSPSPFDDIFDQACDNFVEQLKKGGGKKRGRRKKIVEADVLAKLESVTREKPLDVLVTIKTQDMKIENAIIPEDLKSKNGITVNAEEIKADDIKTNNVKSDDIKTKVIKNEDVIIEVIKSQLKMSPIQNEIVENKKGNEDVKQVKIVTPKVEEDSDSDVPLSKCKKVPPPVRQSDLSDDDDILIKKEVSGARRKLDSSDSSSESETENQNRSVEEKLKQRINRGQHKKGSKNSSTLAELGAPTNKPGKKPIFGDGSGFYPGWEEELCQYKKSLRMPPTLIHVTRPPNCHRLSTSLPDLDPCPLSPSPSSVADNAEYCKFKAKTKSENFDSDMDSNSSFNFSFTKTNYDSEEGSSSVKSLNISNRSRDSILDRLLERYGGKKRKRLKKKDELTNGPKIIPKSDNPLLPTPSLQLKQQSKKSEPIIKGDSIFFGFRKKTVDNFKDTFINNTIAGVNEQFTTVVMKSRTRTETRVLKQKATIREVFGEDRPASAPPVTCVDDLKLQKEPDEDIKEVLMAANRTKSISLSPLKDPNAQSTKEVLKNKLLSRGRKAHDLLKALATKKFKTKYDEEKEIKPDIDSKSETPSLDGDESSLLGKKRIKLRNVRRKGSSGFDYIRKKKKQVKKESVENESSAKPKRRGVIPKANPESVQDIQKEIKMWVLNKGIGETHLHRSARLGYTDITAYCLEKMECSPSPKDNAGYTPLHEACSRGHLNIAKLLLLYGANASESAQGGIRPLHEAAENGFVEIVRLLLSYGADPMLATYSGSTPLSLAVEACTQQLLMNHLSDTKGLVSVPWNFNGPASCFDLEESGYDPLTSPPPPDPPSEEEDMELEVSDILLPNLYTIRGEPQTDRWVLLQDLSNMLKIKSRDALLKQINPSSSPHSASSVPSSKNMLRELKMTEFLEQAHCCQFLNASEKINTRASKIALVRYTDKVRQLLNIEKVLITAR